MRKQQEPFTQQEILKLVGDKQREKFWGTIELQFQRGNVVIIRTHQIEKKENYQFNAGNTNR